MMYPEAFCFRSESLPFGKGSTLLCSALLAAVITYIDMLRLDNDVLSI